MGDVDGGPEWRIWVVVVHWDSGEWRVVDVFFIKRSVLILKK